MNDKHNKEIMISKQCPFCFEIIDIDISKSAYPFSCNKCSEDFMICGGYKISYHRDIFDLSSHINTAVSKKLWVHALTIIHKNNARKETFSSGIALRHENKDLVITCGHSINLNFLHQYRIAHKKLQQGVTPTSTPFIKAHKWDIEMNEPDVGIFEVNKDVFQDLGVTPISIDKLSDETCGNPRAKAWLLGSPADYVIQSADFQNGTVADHCATVVPSALESWHALAQEFPRKLDADRDLIVYRDKYGKGTLVKVLKNHLEHVDPHGMSGGGYWQFEPSGIAKTEVWNPERIKLIGIQSTQSVNRKFLQGVQIAWWIKLFSIAYPEFEQALRDDFPRISYLEGYSPQTSTDGASL